MVFRPCIDLHEGKVKQIVGSTLRDGEAPKTNFTSDLPPRHFAELYREDGLVGAHVIMLGPGNENAALESIQAFPSGLQVGGGITPDNAQQYLDAGASHVIITSYLFRDGLIDWDRLDRIKDVIPRKRLVLDLSCRKRDGQYYIVTNRWQRFTDHSIDSGLLNSLAQHCDEFLVHAVDVEGMCQGIDLDLVRLLADCSPIVATYAGGARSLEDMVRVYEIGKGRLNLTIGSALDIFGGPISYKEAVAVHRQLGCRKV